MTLVNQENAGGIVATKGIPDYTLWEKPAVVPVLDQLREDSLGRTEDLGLRQNQLVSHDSQLPWQSTV